MRELIWAGKVLIYTDHVEKNNLRNLLGNTLLNTVIEAKTKQTHFNLNIWCISNDISTDDVIF